VPTIDPLWGEGIHKCMESGRVAAVTADKCLTPNDPDTSAENMATYDELWHERVAPRMRNRLTMTKLLYLAPNERYDQLMADLHETPDETLAKANKGSPIAIGKLIHTGDLPILVDYAKEQFDAAASNSTSAVGTVAKFFQR
jgi:digeranylgeranylglycerophospholipid reductase